MYVSSIKHLTENDTAAEMYGLPEQQEEREMICGDASFLSKPTFSVVRGTITHKLLLLRLLVTQTADSSYIILHNDITQYCIIIT